MTNILIGENKHLVRAFTQADASPLIISSLASLAVELWQGNKRIVTYTLGTDSQLVANPGDAVGNQVRLEITETFSSENSGIITEKWKLSLSDASYISGLQVDKLTASDITII